MAEKTGWQVVFNTVTSRLMPLSITVQGITTLGRRDRFDGSQPDIDFGPFQALEHGISRQHVALLGGDDGVLILDLNSTNGTWLNERYLTPHQSYPLRVGDHIQIGGLQLTVQVVSRVLPEGQDDDTVITNAPRPPAPEEKVRSLLDRMQSAD